MRSTGLYFIGGGFLGGVICLILKQTTWFAKEQTYHMSEPVEFITSAFWACVLLLLIGLFLFARSFRKKKPAPSVRQTWQCACCGENNPMDTAACLVCGMPYGSVPQQQAPDIGNWICPWCGRVWSENASVCSACGYDRYASDEDET